MHQIVCLLRLRPRTHRESLHLLAVFRGGATSKGRRGKGGKGETERREERAEEKERMAGKSSRGEGGEGKEGEFVLCSRKKQEKSAPMLVSFFNQTPAD